MDLRLRATPPCCLRCLPTPPGCMPCLANQRSHLRSDKCMTCARVIYSVVRTKQRRGRRPPSAHRSNFRRVRTLYHPDPTGQKDSWAFAIVALERGGGVRYGRTPGSLPITVKVLPSTTSEGGPHAKTGAALTMGEQGTHFRRLLQDPQ